MANSATAQKLIEAIKSGARLSHVAPKYHLSLEEGYKILSDNNINYSELLEQRRLQSESLYYKRKYQPPCKEKLISEFRRITILLGKNPSEDELNRLSKINYRYYRLAFGTMSNAIKEVALATRAQQVEDEEILKQQLIAHLKQTAYQLGYIPEKQDFLNDATHHYVKYQYVFGSLKKAVEISGLRDDKILTKVKHELINHLRQKAILLGRAPLKIELMRDKKCNYMKYYAHFGGLRNALKEAGIPPSLSPVFCVVFEQCRLVRINN